MTIIRTQFSTAAYQHSQQHVNVNFRQFHCVAWLNMNLVLTSLGNGFYIHRWLASKWHIFVFNLFPMPSASSDKLFSINYSLNVFFFSVVNVSCDLHIFAQCWSYSLNYVTVYFNSMAHINANTVRHRFMHLITRWKWLMNTCVHLTIRLQFTCISMWISNIYHCNALHGIDTPANVTRFNANHWKLWIRSRHK